MTEDSVVVHKYFYLDDKILTAQASSTSQSLQEGRELVNQTLRSTKWFHTDAACSKRFWVPGSNVYMYVPIPDVLHPSRRRDLLGYGSGCDSNSGLNMPEWNSPVDGAEVLDMDNLPLFESTDLDDLFDPRNAPLIVERNLNQQTANPPSVEQLDHSTLFKVFPQPHIHVFGNFEVTKPFKIPVYSKTDPIPIFPYTLPLKSPSNARRAWLVPVRGILPWEHATPAVLLDPKVSPQSPRSPNPALSLPIVWTHASLRAFWTSLLELKRRTGLGPISVSFTAAGCGSLQSFISRIPRSEYMDSDEEEEVNPSPNPISGSDASDTPAGSNFHPNPLDSVDYIKIYHQSQFSMHFRNMVDRFGFEMKAGDGNEKVRVLKKARLVLVDDVARGVLVS
ncbi:hypothetical protein E1B28_006350 [Marasmius oreades]|uniref:Uncharacterized protein n=1 Tax=Marasmius oreades TaxID=181124 RepID=A0A9P7UW47_9AGAR|nr:uncharacterized protein E1B28_006350 [Marasmius oreades]KAG7095626.1 hypothetical protein E1B28_006350 [Marasmius oreades]